MHNNRGWVFNFLAFIRKRRTDLWFAGGRWSVESVMTPYIFLQVWFEDKEKKHTGSEIVNAFSSSYLWFILLVGLLNLCVLAISSTIQGSSVLGAVELMLLVTLVSMVVDWLPQLIFCLLFPPKGIELILFRKRINRMKLL